MWFLLFNRFHCTNSGDTTQQAGFTLVELLLIIVLLGILSVAAINAFDGNEDQARENITRLEMAELQKALLQFRRDNRELPCMVYSSGNYYPDETNMTRLDFDDLPATPSTTELAAWCDDSLEDSGNDIAQADNGLSMLNQFPYPITASNANLMWDQNTQRGWNGPYISDDTLLDGWGNRYRLLDPELSYNQLYRCLINGSGDDYELVSGQYDCLPPSDISFTTDHVLPADIARIVSTGPDGVLDSSFDADPGSGDDPCVAEGDDLVLCLLR